MESQDNTNAQLETTLIDGNSALHQISVGENTNELETSEPQLENSADVPGEKESDNDSRSSTPTAKDLAKQLKQLQDSIQTLYLNNSLPIVAKDRNYRTPSRTEREQRSEKDSSNRDNSQRYNRSRSYERNKRTPSPYNRDSRNDSRNRNTNSSSSRSNYYRNNSPYKDSRSRDRSNSPYRNPGNS